MIERPEPFSPTRQEETFAPRFRRLADVLARDPSGLELRADPAALAPERLLVFEVRGAIDAFANAVRRVPGLELVDEEELTSDDSDKAPVTYLMVPDARALQELSSLWQRWQRGQIGRGETPWRDVFALLRDLRPWGPQDRVQPADGSILEEEIAGRLLEEAVRLEVELVYRSSARDSADRLEGAMRAVQAQGGRTVSHSRIEGIAYDALLVDLPVAAVRRVIDRAADGLAGLESIMHIRPQSVATGIEVTEPLAGVEALSPAILADPILAVLDGVPVAAHPALAAHLIVDDQFDLEQGAAVADRVHGTAMASLIVHGDRNQPSAPLPRRVHMVPVMGSGDRFPPHRLIVDVIYTAVRALREGTDASAPGVLIINVSLGNPRRPFQGQLSAWARLLDRLAYQYGILFIVSAGNRRESFGIEAFATRTAFEDADTSHRATETLRAIGAVVADRRLISPAETINGLTVGACNEDAVRDTERAMASANVDPFGTLRMPNPSSALGPGFALAVKPDVLLPGSREHLRFIRSHSHIDVEPAGPARGAGLRVAAPPRGGVENADGFTGGTSAAAALASRTAHQIHDALEAAYGEPFLQLSHHDRAVLLKALLAHTACWPEDSASLIRQTLGPADGHYHVRQKDNIRRFLGFGMVDADDAVACASDRATFWATGSLKSEKSATVEVPVPVAMGGHPSHARASFTLPDDARRRRLDLRAAQAMSPDQPQPPAGAPISRSRWTSTRLVKLGFLIGRGHDAKTIAAHRDIESTSHAVTEEARRHGYVFREDREAGIHVELRAKVLRGLEREARRRHLQPHELASALLILLAEDETLLANVLDDDVGPLLPLSRADNDNRISFGPGRRDAAAPITK